MALPTILLREFQTDSISDWVPGKLAQTYQQLEALSFGILNRDSKQWSVHFHLEDGVCEGKALPLLWNNAAYFDESCLQAGKLHLFAHFEPVEAPRTHSSIPRTGSMAPSTSVNTESTRPPTHSSSATMVDEIELELPLNSQKWRSPNKPLTLPRKHKHAKIRDLSSGSDSEGSGETQFLMSPSDQGAELEDEDHNDSAQHNPASFKTPQLPPDATADQHWIDFEAAVASNAPFGQYGYRANWDDVSKGHRTRVAHARMINGIYGIPAPVACDLCAKKGLTCRIYHPNLKEGRLSGACSECRFQCRTCIIEGVGHRKKRASTVPDEDERPSKAPRLIKQESPDTTPAMTTNGLYYCPVLDCSRHWEGIRLKHNFAAHMKQRHPEEAMPMADDARTAPVQRRRSNVAPKQRLFSENISNTRPRRTTDVSFVCPEPGCTSTPVGGYARGDYFRKHVRTAHPESIHAQILQAVVDKTHITLPSPPPVAEYAQDFQEAHENNATEGAFGHRPDEQWTANIRTRVAHARLIHDKHGVVAPESCANCKKRKTTCMVYHPGLTNVGRSLGTYCAECRLRGDRCEIDSQMWGRILEPPTGDVSADEGQQLHITAAEDEDEEHEDAEAGAMP